MRNSIKEYIEYTEKEKQELWGNATFVFDTNVFLNLYRYSDSTINQLLESFEWLKPRIWMPYQVAKEFCEDRYSVIDEMNQRFDKIRKKTEVFISDLEKELRTEENDRDIDRLSSYIKKWIDTKENKYHKFNVTNDVVFERLLDLFDGKVGDGISKEEKEHIKAEGEQRYVLKIPPGYKDSSKDGNQYGDLYIWKEILDYSSKQQTDIILVTQDKKEDWWNISSGKTIGPRIELRKEFYETTGKRFHMYTMPMYLKNYTIFKRNVIDKTTIDEVETTIHSILARQILDNRYDDYMLIGYAGYTKEMSRLMTKINQLEAKNNKRRRSISTLERKMNNQKLSQQEEIALKRNIQNLREDEKLIDGYNKRIALLREQSETR